MSAADVVAWLSTPTSERRLIVGANLHALYLLETEPSFRRLYDRADLVIADGFPVAKFAGRGLSHGQTVERVGSTDWIDVLDASTRQLRIALIGATPESNAMATDRLRSQFPVHKYQGWDGYGQITGLVADSFSELHQFDPDVVLIGLGMPRQEQWLLEHWSDLPPACTVALVGGAIDHVSGLQRLAPRWLGNMGLEWLWRLAHQPRRLAHRYLVEPAALAIVLIRKRWRQRS